MRYETVLGGRRQVVLEDGSTIELNTSTVIRTAVSGVTRDVWLDRGEAFFSINHESAPFVVHAGSRLITDLGTRFLVRREGESVRVAVTDGRVRVTEANTTDPSPTATIQKGDMLEAEGDSTLVIQNTGATIARTLAWRSGMLEFDRTPLLRAAQEFNRYNQHKLSVTGKAAEIPIGGSFRVSNIQGFARLLHDAYGLRIDETAAETKISG
jgi:transmembrane sensor